MNTKNILISTLMAVIAVASFAEAKPGAPARVPSYAAEPVASLASAVGAFSVEKNVDVSGDKVVYKNLPAGVKVSIAATTYEQLISPEGKIRHPISPKKTKVTFKLVKGGDSALTQTFDIDVPVKAVKSGGNAKPAVVPAIQEWTGSSGNFKAGKNCKIVISERDAKQGKPNFEKRMNLFARELGCLTGGKVEVKVVPANELDSQTGIILQILPKQSELVALGEEGYKMNVRGNAIRVESCDATGAFWATRTILQVLTQHKNAFPCGVAVDYPQYPVRGFMLDVGRKPVSMETLKNTMRTMAYYKMNDFQVHLNDNYIWMHRYTNVPNGKDASAADKKKAIEEVLAAAPTAFRMESKFKGKDGTPLTSQDLFYTKKEFGEFIDLAKLYGVGIVPEFDVPGHAMSLVKIRPDLMYRGAVTKANDVERTAMLDASNDKFKGNKTYRQETLEFVKSVFDEYLKPQNGQEPVFRDCKIHIGTDEYYGNAEDYRAFAAEMLKYIKSLGRTPRLWGSFSYKPGKTPVDGTGCEIDMWNLGWQNPRQAVDEYNFDVVNIQDVVSYIVPSGTGSAGGYGDFLNLPHIYSQKWHPHMMGDKSVLAGHPKLLGAEWAIWNDNSFMGDIGISDYELFSSRIAPGCAVYAEKGWNTGEDRNYEEFKSLREKIGFSPGSNPTYVVPADKNGVIYKKSGKVVLKGGDSVETTDFVGIAPDYEAEFTVRRDKGGEGEQVLFSSPVGKIMAVQKDTGKFGIVRDTWLYSFDYTLPENKAVKIKLVAKGNSLTLFADGKQIGKPKRHLYDDKVKSNSFVFPLKNFGAHKNAFKGTIENLTIKAVE